MPSPLEVSDAMPLLAAVDAIVLVARAGHTHERSARRLWQLLASTPTAPVLGVVANGVSPARDADVRHLPGSATAGLETAMLIRR